MKINEDLSIEIVKFMRGMYKLDEVPGMYYDTRCLRFRQGKRTIVSINLYDDRYDFQIIFGKKEREKFNERRDDFSEQIKKIYDSCEILHDGKWMMFSVSELEMFEDVKKMIMIKKNPNRKPLAKDNAVYGKCGHRCDLCVHYTGITQEYRNMLIPHLNSVYGTSSWEMRCTGCDTSECHCNVNGNQKCDALTCLDEKDIDICMSCSDYPCHNSTVGYTLLEHKFISVDDVTYAILPYVPYQYEK